MDESVVIRAAALRALRYMIKNESDVAIFNTLKLSHLVTRYQFKLIHANILIKGYPFNM